MEHLSTFHKERILKAGNDFLGNEKARELFKFFILKYKELDDKAKHSNDDRMRLKALDLIAFLDEILFFLGENNGK